MDLDPAAGTCTKLRHISVMARYMADPLQASGFLQLLKIGDHPAFFRLPL
jgi:hypothetical protein